MMILLFYGIIGKSRKGVISLFETLYSNTTHPFVLVFREDGYEDVLGTASQSETEIWGDRNCTNGYRPDQNCTSDDDDVLEAGDAIVINNVVELPRNDSQFFYDGDDMVLGSDAIVVVRGGFAVSTGPLLAGAVEVYPTLAWGTYFVSPIGEDTIDDSTLRLDPFRTTSLYITAKEDTDVEFSNSTGTNQVTLAQGETFVINGVEQGDFINSTEPIQVHILTGENGAPYYELRWYSLLSTGTTD